MRVVHRGKHTKLIGGCDKIAYRTRAKALKDQRNRLSHFAGRKEAYECRYCGLWHVTTVDHADP